MHHVVTQCNNNCCGVFMNSIGFNNNILQGCMRLRTNQVTMENTEGFQYRPHKNYCSLSFRKETLFYQ